MIESLFLAIPSGYDYQCLKKPFVFQQKQQSYSCWAFKWPLTIYSADLKQKHVFSDGRLQVSNNSATNLQQKWKYFVVTKNNNKREYCTFYTYYEKDYLRIQQTSLFGLNSKITTNKQFYMPKCLILISDKAYYKLQTNLIKIHRELRLKNPNIYKQINQQLLSNHDLQLQLKRQDPIANLKNKQKSYMMSSVTTSSSFKQLKNRKNYNLTHLLFNYYLAACNEKRLADKIFVSSENNVEILHLYNIPDSIYRFNYFFHVPLSTNNLLTVISAILQQKQIIFSSSNQNSNLMLMQTLLQMISPLKWQYMYAPNLPQSMIEAAQESFMPYMVGIHKKFLNRISKKGRIIVHVDSDKIEIYQPLLELPETLRAMFNLYQNNNPNIKYLQWEKLLRIKSILMVSTLLTQFPIVQKNQYHHPEYKFYYQFFMNSAFYQRFKSGINQRPNMQMSSLFWMPPSAKVGFIQSQMNRIQFEANSPVVCDNRTQWIKYYFNRFQKTRKSLKNIRSSHASKSIDTISFLRNSVFSSVQTQNKDLDFSDRKNNIMPKRGIGFISTLKN